MEKQDEIKNDGVIEKNEVILPTDPQDDVMCESCQ